MEESSSEGRLHYQHQQEAAGAGGLRRQVVDPLEQWSSRVEKREKKAEQEYNTNYNHTDRYLQYNTSQVTAAAMGKGRNTISPDDKGKEENSELPEKSNSWANGTSGAEHQPENGDEIKVVSGSEEKKDEKQKLPMVGFFELFRFADGKDRVLLVIGMAMACIHGSAMPLMIVVFGGMMDTFLGNDQFINFWTIYGSNITATYNMTSQQLAANATLAIQICDSYSLGSICNNLGLGDANTFTSTLNQQILYFVLIGVVTMAVSFIELLGFQVSACRQTHRIRLLLFRAVLRQEIGWFDTHEVGELNSRLADDIGKIEQGIGEKLGNLFQYLCAALAGFIVAMVYGWKLTLVVLSVSPLLVVCSFMVAKTIASLSSRELLAYAKAGAVAEEVLVAIRTVVAFGGEEKECSRYTTHLLQAKKQGILKGVLSGVTTGTTYLVFFSSYSLAFWYGSVLVREDPSYTAGKLLIVFFCVMIGSSQIGNAGPSMQYLGTARGAAHMIYAIIDNEPSIDSSSTEGKTPDIITGNIQFRGVSFQYPSRPDVPILRGLDLSIYKGQTVALVGASGCGKSTTIQLLQRFYDPIKGSIHIDEHDVRDLNLEWLRRHIGVVSQEPVLFGTTIAENIRYGRDDVTQAEIEAAAINSNAHDFISKLPAKYETMVGERGAQLSGGQKQRIAIARALVRDPKILLLDEATSALDTTSEAIVQSALDKAREGRTTVVIAHRLSTIRTADVIAGFENGVIVEQGTHDELMQEEGVYYTLVMNQTNAKRAEEEEEEKKDEGSNSEGDPQRPKLIRRKSTIVKRKSVIDPDGEVKEIEEVEEVEEEEELKPVALSRITKLNQPECGAIILGCFGAMVAGSIQPVFAFVFSSIVSVFSIVDPVEQAEKATFYSLLFLAIGAGAFIGNVLQDSGLAISGENLTMRMRQMAFRATLRQEISWYDKKENNVGALTTRLATDASTVKGATGSQLATVLRALTAVLIGCIIGFYYSWALTLVILAMGPIIFLSSFIRYKLVQGAGKGKDKQAMEDAGKVAVETIENIRTVVSLSKETHFYEMYTEYSGVPYRRKMKRMVPDAIAFGFSQGIQFLVNSAVFAFGAYLIQNHGLTFDAMFKVFSAVVFTAIAVGQSSSFAPDYGKAKEAAAKIFAIVDRVPPIDSYSPDGMKPAHVRGVVEVCSVHFNYPNRPEVKVLKGLNMQVSPGQTLALVGPSGCGKSTSIQLMERFYDPDDGSMVLDGVDTKQLNLKWLRSKIALVSQEPMLFDCSIRENIEYGDLSREVTMDEIIRAARQANIHEFIVNLPDGYETGVGDKGAQLSGGQKQRIAIARALIRDPTILLLDEATSALDTESEKVVQEALDKAREGRTCIVIAHRLSTIRNADAIAVINNGVVSELGTHSELMFKEGLYYKLNNAQSMLT